MERKTHKVADVWVSPSSRYEAIKHYDYDEGNTIVLYHCYYRNGWHRTKVAVTDNMVQCLRFMVKYAEGV